MSAITTAHNGTEIAYDEGANLWRFTLRGRDRSTDSLAKAREVIDKPVSGEKAKAFAKFPAWIFLYGDKPEKVEVTGIADVRSYSGSPVVWVKDSEGKRSKQRVSFGIYECSADNDAKVEQIIAKMEEGSKLDVERRRLKSDLKEIQITREE